MLLVNVKGIFLTLITQVMKIVRAIRNGWIKPKKDDKADKPRYYLIWDKEDDQVCGFQ